MTFQFRPAKRSEAKPLIGLYSESGCGKTLSALYLARGFVGPKGKIGMIETEAGRGEAYADTLPGSYDVLPIRGDFAPKNYGLAITAAEQAGLDALIIDSASHEWEGAGGVLALAAQNQADGKKGPLVWQMPKMDHQRHFMLRLLSTPIPMVIVCMRAKYPMQEVKKPNGQKEWMRSDVLDPKQSDDILFEMFVHGWIDKEHRFHGTKYTLDELRLILKDGEPISIETGRQLAEWAKAGSSIGGPAHSSGVTQRNASAPQTPEFITGKQAAALLTRFTEELSDDLQPHAKRLLAEFLETWSIDPRAIPVAQYAQIGKKAIEHARGLFTASTEEEAAS